MWFHSGSYMPVQILVAIVGQTRAQGPQQYVHKHSHNPGFHAIRLRSDVC